ncbi:hypothetical protein GBAR_LOCUS2911, partial [Geodia barretti]
ARESREAVVWETSRPAASRGRGRKQAFWVFLASRGIPKVGPRRSHFVPYFLGACTEKGRPSTIARE